MLCYESKLTHLEEIQQEVGSLRIQLLGSHLEGAPYSLNKNFNVCIIAILAGSIAYLSNSNVFSRSTTPDMDG